jgi:hypothetical protein
MEREREAMGLDGADFGDDDDEIGFEPDFEDDLDAAGDNVADDDD